MYRAGNWCLDDGRLHPFRRMDELRWAIRDKVYAPGEELGDVSRTDDPVADPSVSGASYLGFALADRSGEAAGRRGAVVEAPDQRP